MKLPANWKTMVGGMLGLLSGSVLAAAMFANLTLSPNEMFFVGLANALAVGLVGFAAKDFDTHSTIAEVRTATIKEEQKAVLDPPTEGK